jgi:hypothetical protein
MVASLPIEVDINPAKSLLKPRGRQVKIMRPSISVRPLNSPNIPKRLWWSKVEMTVLSTMPKPVIPGQIRA